MLQFYLPPLLVVFVPAFTLGFLHTAIPCEDKAIFFFWSLGISKTPFKSILILVLYGLGLISSNLVIAFITVSFSFIPQIFIPGFNPDRFAINFFGAIVSIFASILLLLFIMRRKYMPHSKYREGLVELNWEKKKTPYLFGILAGFAPCIFELIIYSQCLTYSLSGFFVDGIFLVFYFSLGTFVGLFPLALAKHGTSQMLKAKEPKTNRILLSMIFIIIAFNAVIMILSFLHIPVFPEITL